MRRKVGVTKAESATATATPTHRLTDIVVHEVSFVDRPANRRKFLVVKRDTTAKDDEVKEPKGTEGPTKMKITPKAKKELSAKLKRVLTALESAEEDESQDKLPEELEATLASLAGLVSEQKTPEKETPKEEPESDDDEDEDEDSDDETEAEGSKDDGEEKLAAKPDGDKGEVAKAGRKMAKTRTEKLRNAVTALSALLSEVDDDSEPEPTQKSAKKKVVKSEEDPLLREIAENLTLVTKAVAIQKQRLDKLAKSSNGSRQAGLEKSGAPQSDQEISWPQDMNRPIRPETTPVEKSFF